MSLTAFLQQYVKPSRWWRRQRTIQITVWPRWLAQVLCPHLYKQLAMWDADSKTKTNLCLDCHKLVEELNDCAHGEVTVWATNFSQPLTYKCEHCGVELEFKNLPKGVRIIHLRDSF